MELNRVKDEVRRITLEVRKKGILATGLFGSLTRGDFDERSDIDIFVITEKELPLRQQDELYEAFGELIPMFGRDITVLVYDLNGLKRIPTWQTLNLVKDACFAYDRAEIEKTFKRILQEAEEHGIIYDDQEKVFRLKRAERLVFSLGVEDS
ncbi:MAG: nucleotidyltransferase family protein [Anaerolineae bacterium]